MKKQSFDDALKRLEEIVEQLESGQLNLEDSLARFEEGSRFHSFAGGIA
jgi:exodeoxyribonuclease VII small subunit